MTTRFLSMLVLLLVALAGGAAAEEKPEIVVEVRPQRVYEGQPVAYRVTLNHVENPSRPELKGFDDFDVAFAGEQSLDSRQVTVINGQVSEVVRQGKQYTFRLTPRKTGVLTIPAPVAHVGGLALRGPERKLVVVPAAEQDVVQVEIALDRPSVYPMQPFVVTLSIFVKGLPDPNGAQNPLSVQRNPPAVNLPWATDDDLPAGLKPQLAWKSWLSGFQSRERVGWSINGLRRSDALTFFDDELVPFRPGPRKVARRDKSGREVDYWEYRFPRTFVAEKAGRFGFGPVTVQGDFAVRVDERRQLIGEEIYALAKPVEMIVKDVPDEDRPATFTGAVGRFRIAADVAPRQAKVGDPMTLTITLSGEGTLDSTRAPSLAKLPEVAAQFRLYEATEQTKDNTCRFTYSLRPLKEGIKAFPSVPLAYFDVQDERYQVLHTEPIPVTITRAERLTGDQIVQGARPTAARNGEIETRREGIFANVTDLAAVRDESVHPRRWLTAVAGLAGLYLAAAVFFGRARRLSADQPLVRRRSAPGRARRRLGEARQRVEAGQLREGVDQAESALIGLIADMAGVPEAGMTGKDARRELASLGAADDLADRIARFLDACDATRYGAADRSAGGLSRQAEPLLDELIAAFKARKRFR